MAKSKHESFYDFDRNGKVDPKRQEFIKKMQAIEYGTEYKEPGKAKSKTPDYYIGSEGLEAIDVVHQFNLSYDLGNACSYILRAKNKHQDGGKECITKAIRHLQYELIKIKKKTINQS